MPRLPNNLGAILILATGVFGMGFLAAPEVKVVEKTNMDIKVVRVPDTRVITKTKTVTEDLPSVCKKVTKLNEEYQDLLDRQAANLSVGPGLISEARIAIYSQDFPATTKVIEGFDEMKATNFELIDLLHTAKKHLQGAIDDCEAAQK